MSSEPFVPNAEQIVGGFAEAVYHDSEGMKTRAEAEAEARRGIAKVKADAVREAAKQFWNPRGESTDDDAKRILNRIASRIEEES